MITVYITEGQTEVTLGRRGENLARDMVFPLDKLIEDYGEGTATLMVKRSQDTDAYPAATTQEDDGLHWVLNSADTAYKGLGKAEVFWYVDEQLAKSVVYNTWTDPDIGGVTETPPAPQAAWITQLLADIRAELDAEELVMDGKVATAKGYADDAKDYKNEASGFADAAAASAQEASNTLSATIYVDDNGNFQIKGE